MQRQEALGQLQSSNYDALLVDLQMPVMNGYQATRELSRDPDTAAIPVVMVTTKGDETDRIWGMRQGATDYIVKPVSEMQLVNKIKTVLGH